MTDRPFNLVNYLPAVQIEYIAASTNDWVLEAPITANWVTESVSGVFTFEDQLDIRGWTKEGLTAFFASQYLQRASPYGVTGIIGANGGLEMADYLIVTDVPLTTNWWATLTAGFPTSDSDYMTIKFAQGTQWTQQSTQPITMVRSDVWNYGSGEPTAAGTLYFYRAIIVNKDTPQPNDGVTVPELRYVGAGIATEEPEFVYLTRLRRSFELQQS